MNKVVKNIRGKKWLITVFLIVFLIAVLFTGGYVLNQLHEERTADLALPYDISEEMYGTDNSHIQKAPSYTSKLCVTAENNIYLDGVEFSSHAYGGLFHVEQQKVLFAQGIYEKIYPASITKIMTAILALKYGNMEDIVTISADALNLEDGSTEVGFQPGDQVSMEELFHGLLIYSGNDAAMTIAQHVGGTVEHFVEMMNEEAARLGATKTHFANPTGLHDEQHYTTVYDIYLMLTEALTYPEFVSVIQKNGYNLTYKRGEESLVRHLDSTDQYLTKQIIPPKNVNILGGKTGTTSQAGSCLALVSQNAYGEPFISIVVHAPNKTILYENMNSLLSKIN